MYAGGVKMPRDYSASWAQKKFAEEFHLHGDRAKAARACGSQAKDFHAAGTKLLTNSKIKRLLAEYDLKSEAATVRKHVETENEVHALIDEGIDLARKGKVVVGKDGKVVKDDGKRVYNADVPSLLKGAELKGKTIAMFVDKQRIEGEMEGLSNPELLAVFLAALAANEMLCKDVCREELIIRTVNEQQRNAAASDEGGEGVRPEEAESLPPSSEAGTVPPRRLH